MAIDGRPVRNLFDLTSQLDERNVGDTVEVRGRFHKPLLLHADWCWGCLIFLPLAVPKLELRCETPSPAAALFCVAFERHHHLHQLAWLCFPQTRSAAPTPA